MFCRRGKKYERFPSTVQPVTSSAKDTGALRKRPPFLMRQCHVFFSGTNKGLTKENSLFNYSLKGLQVQACRERIYL